MKSTFIIKEDRHFTAIGLVEYMNRNYKGLTSKLAFNHNDIHQYIIRGKLPDYAGGKLIKTIYIPYAGVKLYELS